MDSVITYALIFCAIMGLFIWLGGRPTKPKKPKGIVLPKLKGRKG